MSERSNGTRIAPSRCSLVEVSRLVKVGSQSQAGTCLGTRGSSRFLILIKCLKGHTAIGWIFRVFVQRLKKFLPLTHTLLNQLTQRFQETFTCLIWFSNARFTMNRSGAIKVACEQLVLTVFGSDCSSTRLLGSTPRPPCPAFADQSNPQHVEARQPDFENWLRSLTLTWHPADTQFRRLIFKMLSGKEKSRQQVDRWRWWGRGETFRNF